MTNYTTTIDEEIRRQDALFEEYQRRGIVNGTPGSATEDEVRAMIERVLTCSESTDAKLDALEAIEVFAQNNLANGMASDVMDEISAAWRDVFRTPASPPISGKNEACAGVLARIGHEKAVGEGVADPPHQGDGAIEGRKV